MTTIGPPGRFHSSGERPETAHLADSHAPDVGLLIEPPPAVSLAGGTGLRTPCCHSPPPIQLVRWRNFSYCSTPLNQDLLLEKALTLSTADHHYASREGDADGHSDTALGASWYSGYCRVWDVGPAPSGKRRGDDRDGVVDPGFRRRGGCIFQEDRRRLREGERQHDRLHHHALRAAAPEDRLGGDERRRPRPVPEHPGRNHCALCMARQAGRRE